MGFLERAAARVQIRRHLSERAEHGVELDGRIGFQRWLAYAARDRQRGGSQFSNRARELAGRESTQPQRGESADPRSDVFALGAVSASDTLLRELALDQSGIMDRQTDDAG